VPESISFCLFLPLIILIFVTLNLHSIFSYIICTNYSTNECYGLPVDWNLLQKLSIFFLLPFSIYCTTVLFFLPNLMFLVPTCVVFFYLFFLFHHPYELAEQRNGEYRIIFLSRRLPVMSVKFLSGFMLRIYSIEVESFLYHAPWHATSIYIKQVAVKKWKHRFFLCSFVNVMSSIINKDWKIYSFWICKNLNLVDSVKLYWFAIFYLLDSVSWNEIDWNSANWIKLFIKWEVLFRFSSFLHNIGFCSL